MQMYRMYILPACWKTNLNPHAICTTCVCTSDISTYVTLDSWQNERQEEMLILLLRNGFTANQFDLFGKVCNLA